MTELLRRSLSRLLTIRKKRSRTLPLSIVPPKIRRLAKKIKRLRRRGLRPENTTDLIEEKTTTEKGRMTSRERGEVTMEDVSGKTETTKKEERRGPTDLNTKREMKKDPEILPKRGKWKRRTTVLILIPRWEPSRKMRFVNWRKKGSLLLVSQNPRQETKWTFTLTSTVGTESTTTWITTDGMRINQLKQNNVWIQYG
jgi:hypothetical protein